MKNATAGSDIDTNCANTRADEAGSRSKAGRRSGTGATSLGRGSEDRNEAAAETKCRGRGKINDRACVKSEARVRLPTLSIGERNTVADLAG